MSFLFSAPTAASSSPLSKALPSSFTAHSMPSVSKACPPHLLLVNSYTSFKTQLKCHFVWVSLWQNLTLPSLLYVSYSSSHNVVPDPFMCLLSPVLGNHLEEEHGGGQICVTLFAGCVYFIHHSFQKRKQRPNVVPNRPHTRHSGPSTAPQVCSIVPIVWPGCKSVCMWDVPRSL